MLTQTANRTGLFEQPTAADRPLLTGLRRQAGTIEMMGALVPFARNGEVYGENEPAEYLYKIVSGTVRAYKVLVDGRRQIGAFYLPGDIFGIETGDEHTFSAEAVTDCKIIVIKRSGATEPFSRQKVILGVRRACQGRPVDDDALALLAQTVEESIRATGVAEVPSDEVGLAILGPLRELDEVAYLRFASVYQAFTSVDDFDKAIGELRTQHRHPPS